MAQAITYKKGAGWQDQPIRNPALRSGLISLSWIYGLIIGGWRTAYRIGFFSTETLPCRVISVGNLNAGGTGKTPAVITLARAAKSLGWNPAVLSRGYGGQWPEEVLVFSDGEKTFYSFPEAADEPVILARNLPGVPIIIAKDRVKAARLALNRFDPKVLILDDGYQALELSREVNLLILEAGYDPRQSNLLPAGRLREPNSQVRRATHILITGKEAPGQHGFLVDWLGKHYPEVPVYRGYYRFRAIEPVGGNGAVLTLSALKNQPVFAFSGIGNPQRFLESLGGWGLGISGFWAYPDHYPYTRKDLREIVRAAESAGAGRILTTEKDAVRLEPFAPFPESIYTVKVDLEIPGGEDVLEWILKG